MEQTVAAKTAWLSWQRNLPAILLAAGLVGLTSSLALTYDKLQLLQNTAYQPSCNLNPIFSCQSVMASPQSQLLGMPNTLFGLVAFSMLAMFGLALLAGARFKPWFWLAAQVAALAGVVGVHYLIFQSAFRIYAICPWCFAVWLVIMPAFVGITVHNIRSGHFGLAPGSRASKAAAFVSRHSGGLLALWYAGLLVLLLVQFWYYWRTLF